MLFPEYKSNDIETVLCRGQHIVFRIKLTVFPYRLPRGGGGSFHSKGTWGCAARKGILFRTPSLAKGIIFTKIGLAKGYILKLWAAHPYPKFSREPPPPPPVQVTSLLYVHGFIMMSPLVKAICRQIEYL